MADIIELETERLLMRQWRLEDREAFYALNSDPVVMKYFPKVLSRLESDAMADRCQALIQERGWGLWAVERRDSGAFIGFVGLNIPRLELPVSPCVEIGWRLARAHWRQGLATEAARAALETGFETLRLEEIVSFTTVSNASSRAVMERLGMVEAAGTFEHPFVPIESGLTTHCLYRLSRAGWDELRGGAPSQPARQI